jgi:hypothetical protein
MLATIAVVDPSSRPRGADLRGAFLPAAHAILDGRSPYPSPDDPVGHYLYTPQFALLLTPLALVSEQTAVVLAVLGSAALVAGALALAGVRDVRCYAAAFLWAPTWNQLDMASLTAALLFSLAVAWRYRERSGLQGIALGLAIPAKLFLWPLLGWTLATRRWRATVVAVLVGVFATATAWAAVGLRGLADYPALLHALTESSARDGYSLYAASTRLGLSADASYALALVVGSGLLAGCIRLARRGDDVRSLTLAVAAALAFTPVLWQHYLILLLVPLAAARPAFSSLWLLPIALWLAPSATNSLPEKVLPLLVATLMVGAIVRRPLALPIPEHSPGPLRRQPTLAEGSIAS